MKTLLSLTTFLLVLLSTTFVSAQSLSSSEIDKLREERAVYLFEMQNHFDLSKEKNMQESHRSVAEKADLRTKRREIQIVDEPSYPKMIETNDLQQGSWEYDQAKQAWIAEHPEKYTSLMQRPVGSQ